jgi:uncharacterized protein
VTIDAVWAFLTGLSGSLHCLGMCGPLVVAYSFHLQRRTPEPPRKAARLSSLKLARYHAAFHGGRIASYVIMGVAAAGLASLAATVDPLLVGRSIISLAGGTAMVMAGLILLRVFPASILPQRISSPSGGFLAGPVKGLLQSLSMRSTVALGFVTGFLPCMLSWAMVIRAATTGSIIDSLPIMASFGLGTVPALFLTGLFASFLTVKMRVVGERIAALSIVVMGIILFWKGISHFV